jgi:hypothetical protein
MADGLFKGIGSAFNRYIGGLLGEDVEKMTPEERRAARMAAIGIIGRGMVSPEGGSQALTAVRASRQAARDAQEAARRGAAAEAMLPQITGRLFGGLPAQTMPVGGEDELTGVNISSPYRQDPTDAMRMLTATQAGRDIAAVMPDLAKLAQEGVTGRVVGGAVQNPLTGAFSKPPEEKKAKTRVGSEDLNDRVRVYFSDGTYEDLRKGLAPGADGGPRGIGGAKPTAGMKKLDETFAKDWAEFSAQGGFADTQKQVGQLREVIATLRSGENVTGPMLSYLMDNYPNLAASYASGAVQAKDLVEEVVQRNLRVVLGSQFTAEEAKALIKRAYNPALREDINAERLERLLNQIESAAQAKADAGRYFEQYGTLAGHQGKLPSFSSFDPLKEEKTKVPNVGEIVEKSGQRFQYLGGDPSKPQSWRKL